MDITTLPNDIFLIIIDHLSPRDLILCRSVNKDFYAAFTESDLNRRVLQQHYPRTRELRYINPDANWTQVFAKVAGRYQHLKDGKPRSISKHALARSFVVPKWARYHAIAPWQRHLQFEEKSAAFHYPDTLWTYEDGLLIFPSAEFRIYVLYDLELGTFTEVPLESESKIVRRIRLRDKVLVVEWCEEEAYHQLNENETVFRHFATAYDIKQDPSGKWTVVFRYLRILES